MYRKLINAFLWFSAKGRRVALVDLCCIAAALLVGWSMRFSFISIGLDDAQALLRAFASFALFAIGSLAAGRTYRIV